MQNYISRANWVHGADPCKSIHVNTMDVKKHTKSSTDVWKKVSELDGIDAVNLKMTPFI